MTDVSEATVYSSLRRLERNGLLSSRKGTGENGRPRRYYALTSDGRVELGLRRSRWIDLVKTVDSVLDRDRRQGQGQGQG